MKKVFIYDLNENKHHQTKLMINNPPKGYEFVLPNQKNKQNFFNFLKNSKFLRLIYKKTLKIFFPKLNIYLKLNSPEIPSNISLIFTPIPLDTDIPYIIEILDHPASLAGYNYDLFMKKLPELEKKLRSKICKKIIVVNESSMKLMKEYFSKEVFKKCFLVRAAIKKQDFARDYNKKELQILFIGSLANPDDFYIKGGLEALESFSLIAEKYPNLKLIIRCKLPNEIKSKYSHPQIIFLEEKISNNELDNLLRATDIVLQPGHIYPLTATIESMSYGIPIVMLDAWGVRDYLDDNHALLVKPSKKITEYNSKEYPLNIRSKKFLQQIKEVDNGVITDLSIALEKLIQNHSLRKKLGTNAKKIADTKFSLNKRNKILKEIFDKSIN
ncbi:MAG: glycosyltransferase family 4 protein [Candidatus Pacearchaeota archaeon]|nr:glycosyltransferase family 4 protein [Candidatus Pacearchaeota archaeon]